MLNWDWGGGWERHDWEAGHMDGDKITSSMRYGDVCVRDTVTVGAKCSGGGREGTDGGILYSLLLCFVVQFSAPQPSILRKLDLL